jgi:hypothetical protein
METSQTLVNECDTLMRGAKKQLVIVALEVAIEVRKLVGGEIRFGLARMFGRLVFLIHEVLQSAQE